MIISLNIILAAATSTNFTNNNEVELEILAFVPPCLNASDTSSHEKCDIYIYPAILQAIEDVNSHGILCQATTPEDVCIRLHLYRAIQKVN